MADNSDGLIRSALRGNEETSARLRRTQFLGVLILAVAAYASVLPLEKGEAGVLDEVIDAQLRRLRSGSTGSSG